jgi:hypothetical protein
MTDADRLKLLFGPYKPPALRRGDRAFCLYRDAAVVVSGWSAAPIPWPVCYLAGTRAAGRGLLVDEELARAVRHESAAAVCHWWGASPSAVQHWRKALGVGRTDAEGSRRLIRRAVQASLDARHADARLWSAEEVALLGALPDAEVARRTGRSPNAVALKRLALGRPPVRPQRWTPEEDELVRTLPAAEVARKTGRTLVAVWSRRQVLGVPGGRTRAGRRG